MDNERLASLLTSTTLVPILFQKNGYIYILFSATAFATKDLYKSQKLLWSCPKQIRRISYVHPQNPYTSNRLIHIFLATVIPCLNYQVFTVQSMGGYWLSTQVQQEGPLPTTSLPFAVFLSHSSYPPSSPLKIQQAGRIHALTSVYPKFEMDTQFKRCHRKRTRGLKQAKNASWDMDRSSLSTA